MPLPISVITIASPIDKINGIEANCQEKKIGLRNKENSWTQIVTKADICQLTSTFLCAHCSQPSLSKLGNTISIHVFSFRLFSNFEVKEVAT